MISVYTQREITNKKTVHLFEFLYSFCVDVMQEVSFIEEIDPENKYVKAFGRGNTLANVCFYLQPLMSSVNVGFPKGVQLGKYFRKFDSGSSGSLVCNYWIHKFGNLFGEDKVSGKNYRHIQFKSLQEVDETTLKRILLKAIEIAENT